MNRKNTTTKSQTDWERLDAMTDDDIDYSDIPPITDEMWARGVLRKGLKPVPKKQQLTLRVDQDVVDFFKEQGRGYQTKINQLLRAYMEAHHRS
ncbi:MAG: BrnA antitoxin family protein [Acidobacteria bacterium]|nr:BrnA antitoxin family protein [Acidobacteriota bacterium]